MTDVFDTVPSDLRVWRTNPGSVFDYDPAEDNIQSRSLHMMSGETRKVFSDFNNSAAPCERESLHKVVTDIVSTFENVEKVELNQETNKLHYK